LLENHSSIIRSVTSAPRARGRGVGFVFVEKPNEGAPPEHGNCFFDKSVKKHRVKL